MLRQLSAAKLSTPKGRYRVNNSIARSSSSNIYSNNIQKWRNFCHRRNLMSSFSHIQACYFSDAVQRIQNDDDDDDSNIVDKISMTSLCIPEDPSKYVFRYNLNYWYLTHHGETGSSIKDAFKTEFIQNPQSNEAEIVHDDENSLDQIKQLWTAQLKCPITQEEFKAGKLPGYFVIDGRNYYSKKKIALEAVSAVTLSHKTGTVINDDDKMIDPVERDSFPLIVAERGDSAAHREKFRHLLQNHYTKYFKISPSSSQIKIIRQDFVGQSKGGCWWTAEFTCPLTDQTYEASDLSDHGIPDLMMMNEAGRFWYRKKTDAIHATAYTALESIDWKGEYSKSLQEPLDEFDAPNELLSEILRPLNFWYAEHYNTKDVSIEDNFIVTESETNGKSWTASFVCPLTGERFDAGTLNINLIQNAHDDDLFNWYTEKKTAIQAAAFRAYDTFKYQKTQIFDPRFCKENPADDAVGNDPTTLKMSFERNEFAAQEINNDDDYTIEVIPQQMNLSQELNGGSSKTIDIVAQTWIDSTESSIVAPKNGYSIENVQRKKASIELEKAINRAYEWISWQKHEKEEKHLNDRIRFDFEGKMCNLKIANVILSALSDAHQRVPFDAEPNGVEQCAASILESMWSSHSTIPDAQSYAFYLKCLEGQTPRDVAVRAQKVVSAMESGENYNNRKLPKPNGSIYTSISQLNALSGNTSMIGKIEINHGRTDRNIYLSELSAMSHDPSTFDLDLAMNYIDEMRNVAEVSVEVFNAPLRWSCPEMWSRHYSRVIPWDYYNEIYQDGFKLESSPYVQCEQAYAEKLQKWIETMTMEASRDASLAPNIETYESLIQAWVRCGDLKSLLRAETCAKSLLTSSNDHINPRLHTFYPIIAAWVYSGCAEGPRNVESWIGTLQDSLPELHPLVSFPNVQIMAQISLQIRILGSLSDVTDQAAKCSKLLESTIDRYKMSPDFIVQSDMFVLVIHSWYNAAKVASLRDDYDDTKYLQEIENTISLFEDLMVWLHENDTDHTMSHLLAHQNHAPSIYGAQLDTVVRLKKNLRNSQSVVSKSNVCITETLLLIEEKIRRMKELSLFLEGVDEDADSDINRFSKVDHTASFAFPIEAFVGNTLCNSWTDYINLALNILQEDTCKFSFGDSNLIRLCHLIVLLSSSTSRKLTIEKVVTLLSKFSEQNQDQAIIVRAVIQSLQSGGYEPKYQNESKLHKKDKYRPIIANTSRNRKHKNSQICSKVPTNRSMWR